MKVWIVHASCFVSMLRHQSPPGGATMADAVVSLLKKARKECYSEEDAYWAGDGLPSGKQPSLDAPLNPRNEAAALSKLVAAKQDVCKGNTEAEAKLQELCSSYLQRVTPPSPPDTAAAAAAAGAAATQAAELTGSPGTPYPDDSAEARLQSWCVQQGMQSFVHPATFSLPGGGNLRGLAASQNLHPGQSAITVPKQMLISYDYVMASDLGKVLQRIPGLGQEAAAVVWTMVERQDAESTLSHFWQALPPQLGTGLSVPEHVLSAGLPEGSPLQIEAVAARQHLREQHQALHPVYTALCQAYPSYFKEDMFSWDQFLWATELWYAYAISVQLPGGSLQPCLVPFVSLMNHSPLPHIVHYSKVEEATGNLRLMLFRPAHQGEEVTLSYGPLPNSKLLLFYGFTLPGNPFDSATVPLEVGTLPEDPLADIRKALLQSSGLDPLQQRVRQGCPMPSELRAAARLAVAGRKEVLLLKKAKKDARRELMRALGGPTETAAAKLVVEVLRRLSSIYSRSRERLQPQGGADNSEADAATGSAATGSAADGLACGEGVGSGSGGRGAEPGAGGATSEGSGQGASKSETGSSGAEKGAAVQGAGVERAFLGMCRVWLEGQGQAVSWALREAERQLQLLTPG